MIKVLTLLILSGGILNAADTQVQVTQNDNADKTALSSQNTTPSGLLKLYAAAYNRNDVNTVRKILHGDLLNQYKDEYLRYRRDKVKPDLKINIIKEKTEHGATLIQASCSLIVNKQYQYKNRKKNFLVKNIKGNLKITEIKMVKPEKIYNFWEAVKAADAVGAFQVTGKERKGTKKSIVMGRNWQSSFKCFILTKTDAEGLVINMPKEWPYRYTENGTYIIPLAVYDNELVPIGRYFSLPKANVKDVKEYKKIFVQWCKLGTEDFKLISDILKNKQLEAVQGGLLQCLYKEKKLAHEFDDQKITPWLALINAPNLSVNSKKFIALELAKNNFPRMKKFLYDNFNQEKNLGVVIPVLVKYDKDNFLKQLKPYIDIPEKRVIALKCAGLFRDDKDFIKSAMKYFDVKDTKNLNYYIPVLLAPENSEGKKYVKQILQNSKPSKTTAFILFCLYRSSSKEYVTQVFNLCQKIIANRIKGREQLATLGNGIAYLAAIEDREHLKQLLSMVNPKDAYKKYAVTMLYRKALRMPFKTIEDINKFLDSNAKLIRSPHYLKTTNKKSNNKKRENVK